MNRDDQAERDALIRMLHDAGYNARYLARIFSLSHNRIVAIVQKGADKNAGASGYRR